MIGIRTKNKEGGGSNYRNQYKLVQDKTPIYHKKFCEYPTRADSYKTQEDNIFKFRIEVPLTTESILNRARRHLYNIKSFVGILPGLIVTRLREFQY